MIRVVIPYAGLRGKTRLELGSSERENVSLAMLAGVVSVALEVGEAWIVSPDRPQNSDATWIPDAGGGQGAAVAAALLEIGAGPALVVNADLPTLAAEDLLVLDAAVPELGIAIAAAPDGTTNALGLSDTTLFEPLYGPDSAARFREHAERSSVAAVDVVRAGLQHDVDTIADLVSA